MIPCVLRCNCISFASQHLRFHCCCIRNGDDALVILFALNFVMMIQRSICLHNVHNTGQYPHCSCSVADFAVHSFRLRRCICDFIRVAPSLTERVLRPCSAKSAPQPVLPAASQMHAAIRPKSRSPIAALLADSLSNYSPHFKQPDEEKLSG